MNFGDGFFAVFKGIIRSYFKNGLNIEEQVNEVKDFKGAYLMVGQHVAIEDSLIAIAYSGKLIRFLAAEANWDVGWKNLAFKAFNVIPFARQRLDVRAIRKLKETVDTGESVGLFPEGARSWDGRQLPIIPSITKLVKMLKVPVYNITFNGLHLSRPRWAADKRKGKVQVNIKQIISQEQIKTASLEDILTSIERAIVFDDYAWQRKAMVPFKGKNLAEYIERILYRCPACDGINTLASKGDAFTCRACGHVYSVNHFGFIEGCKNFDNTADWNAWQKKRTPEFLSTTYAYTNPNISLTRALKQDRQIEEVDMTLTQDAVMIKFKDGTAMTIPLAETRGCDAVFSDNVEFWFDDTKYQFCFEPQKGHMSVKLFEDILQAHINAALSH